MLSSIADVRSQLHGEVLGRLQQLAFKAVQRVDEVMDTGRDTARIAAAKLVLDQLLQFKDALDDGRLAALEVAHADLMKHLEDEQS